MLGAISSLPFWLRCDFELLKLLFPLEILVQHSKQKGIIATLPSIFRVNRFLIH